jgi:hypothetical protein
MESQSVGKSILIINSDFAVGEAIWRPEPVQSETRVSTMRERERLRGTVTEECQSSGLIVRIDLELIVRID